VDGGWIEDDWTEDGQRIDVENSWRMDGGLAEDRWMI
jgi:hypothetical protein